MIHIKAAQHIYSNVEKELSPNKVGGFQTLFYTKALLTREESEEIEEKLVYYQSETNPKKWMFFPLAAGKTAVTRIVPLTNVDKFGREGSYLAHTILLSAEDFIKAGSNPFIIFDLVEDRFLNKTSEALEKGDPKSANINQLTLEIGEKNLTTIEKETAAAMQEWDAGELKKIAHYTINYQQLKDKRESLVFVGTPGQIKNALKIALMFVPPKLRLNCTFDTYFHDCNLVRNYFWATGYLEASEAAPHLPIVNAFERKVSVELPSDVSPYEEWVYDCISKRKFFDIMSYNSAALELQELLLDNRYDERMIRSTLPDLPEDLIEQIVEVYDTPFTAKIRKKLEEIVGKNIAPRLIDKVLSSSMSQPKRLFYALLDGFDIKELTVELYRIFKKNIKDKPGRKEMKELKAFLKKSKDVSLNVLMALWEEDYDNFTRFLDQLPDSRFREIVDLLVKEDAVSVEKLIPVERLGIFFEIFAAHAQADSNTREEIPGLIKMLVKKKQESKLDVFCPILNQLTLKQLKTVKKIFKKKEKRVPQVFLKTLDDTFRSLTGSSELEKSGSKGLLKGILSKFKFFGKKRVEPHKRSNNNYK